MSLPRAAAGGESCKQDSFLHMGFGCQKVCPAAPLGRLHKKIVPQNLFCYCTEHSDEPFKAKIVFSIGFHDFRVSSPSYKSHLYNILLCHPPCAAAGQTF